MAITVAATTPPEQRRAQTVGDLRPERDRPAGPPPSGRKARSLGAIASPEPLQDRLPQETHGGLDGSARLQGSPRVLGQPSHATSSRTTPPRLTAAELTAAERQKAEATEAEATEVEATEAEATEAEATEAEATEAEATEELTPPAAPSKPAARCGVPHGRRHTNALEGCQCIDDARPEQQQRAQVAGDLPRSKLLQLLLLASSPWRSPTPPPAAATPPQQRPPRCAPPGCAPSPSGGAPRPAAAPPHRVLPSSPSSGERDSSAGHTGSFNWSAPVIQHQQEWLDKLVREAERGSIHNSSVASA